MIELTDNYKKALKQNKQLTFVNMKIGNFILIQLSIVAFSELEKN